ncbi:hypothetical protein [Sinorhizobium psoraleae]|uniref:hypothetical protein n=1 Tax=Sinorhizobium psoraleae TaxID=520838 RepID=UPI00289D6E9A|nr:hypothetical protein [Sinorhizobium psoraleae]
MSLVIVAYGLDHFMNHHRLARPNACFSDGQGRRGKIHGYFKAGYPFVLSDIAALFPLPTSASLERIMLVWFRRLLPRGGPFCDLFEQHSQTIVGGTEAFGNNVER